MQFSQIIAEIVASGNVDTELQAKFLVHKTNFLNKFEKESEKALYDVFSQNFDYGMYQDLQEKSSELHKMFDNGSGRVNCAVLLTTTLNFTPYLKDLDQKSSAVINGMNGVENALNNWSLKLPAIEQKLAAKISSSLTSLNTILLRDFRLMLLSNLPKKVEKTEVVSGSTQNPLPQNPVTSTPSVTPAPSVVSVPTELKVTFTQSFKRGQYSEQIKTLQTILHNWGLYQGAINGLYDKATIEAVYQFQLKHGVVTGKEKKKTGYGRFGVQTRTKINQLING